MGPNFRNFWTFLTQLSLYCNHLKHNHCTQVKSIPLIVPIGWTSDELVIFNRLNILAIIYFMFFFFLINCVEISIYCGNNVFFFVVKFKKAKLCCWLWIGFKKDKTSNDVNTLYRHCIIFRPSLIRSTLQLKRKNWWKEPIYVHPLCSGDSESFSMLKIT